MIKAGIYSLSITVDNDNKFVKVSEWRNNKKFYTSFGDAENYGGRMNMVELVNLQIPNFQK